MMPSNDNRPTDIDHKELMRALEETRELLRKTQELLDRRLASDKRGQG